MLEAVVGNVVAAQHRGGGIVADLARERWAWMLAGFGEPSACSMGAGVFGAFVAGARGTLVDFFGGVLVWERFL